VKDALDRVLRESFIPEQAQDPHVRAIAEHMASLAVQGRIGDVTSDELAKRQDDIEKTAATSIEGLDLGHRPLVGHLKTGQLNAVSMRVPGSSEAYLVLFEDQMWHFIHEISSLLAWAMPRDPTADENGKLAFKLSARDVAERIEDVPEIVDWFADIVVTYAVTGRIGSRFRPLPPGHNNFALLLQASITYFVLGHEYAHIISGHLRTVVSRKGVLPATEAEALVYSWRQELDSDFLGMILSLNAGIDHGESDFSTTFLGIGLFFDALDVMDRAVALLQTGDENACQLGSHPPSNLRKQRLRESLSKLAEANPEGVRTALAVEEIQTEIIRLLWERTGPILLDRRRRGVPAAHTWRSIPKETGDEPTPAPQNAPEPRQARRRGRRWGRSG
jgi:hypothetical protein